MDRTRCSNTTPASCPHSLRWARAFVRAPLRGALLVVFLVLPSLQVQPTVHAANPAVSVSLLPSRPSGQLLGTSITWTASASGLTQAVYRFSVTAPQGPARVVRDFSLSHSFSWTPLQEGQYTIQASVKASFTSTSVSSTSATFAVTSRVSGKTAVVSATANPLVALYSAPACAGGTVVVKFRPATGSAPWQSLPTQPCVAGQSVNVLVAGMRPGTTYMLQDVVSSGATSTPSPQVRFTTGKPEAGLMIPKFTVKQAPTAQSDQATPLTFHALNAGVPPNLQASLANPVATDLQGTVVWYYDVPHSGLALIWPVRILSSGTVLLFGRDQYHKVGDNVFREVNLAGNTVRETNIDAVNAQLAARGVEKIYAFHHDALRLPNGDTAVLGSTMKKISGQDVTSDMVVVLDANLQVTWTWDAFDHLTPPAKWPAAAPTCIQTGPFGLCPLPDIQAKDWTHGNALAWDASDNDLLLSFRNLSLTFKLDYANGKGSGKVLWKLGMGGDFTVKSSVPSPWFTNQHNPNFFNATTLVVFDDGNTRCQNGSVKGCDSRGQVWKVDQTNHTATLQLNADLGFFWQALGSAQGLANGNFFFTGGYSPPSREEEFTAAGTKVFEVDLPLAEYRVYRLAAL
jgi:arylsulfate sulfotransferase